jgi:hypothetical protein
VSEPSEQLDRIAAILALAHRGAISQARADIRSDELSKTILDECPKDWCPMGDIWNKVKDEVDASQRTFQRRLAELVAEGALYQQGSQGHLKYRPTGLV